MRQFQINWEFIYEARLFTKTYQCEALDWEQKVVRWLNTAAWKSLVYTCKNYHFLFDSLIKGSYNVIKPFYNIC